MKDFHEAVLSFEVERGLAQVYKKAIEDENSRYWARNEIKDSAGDIIISDIKPVWNGNYCNVEIDTGLRMDHLTGSIVNRRDGKAKLYVTLISHTLSNLKETVDWYTRMGCEVISTNYKEKK
ncbi:hypothetical protein [Enterococcus devriesei]|uniref:hypothetical protein n=1 Tax=Enterococcus devriesei TaxID=319970 RepID=UPI0028E7FC07|nr:hypothetical protein [Enterococcus devriesei]